MSWLLRVPAPIQAGGAEGRARPGEDAGLARRTESDRRWGELQRRDGGGRNPMRSRGWREGGVRLCAKLVGLRGRPRPMQAGRGRSGGCCRTGTGEREVTSGEVRVGEQRGEVRGVCATHARRLRRRAQGRGARPHAGTRAHPGQAPSTHRTRPRTRPTRQLTSPTSKAALLTGLARHTRTTAAPAPGLDDPPGAAGRGGIRPMRGLQITSAESGGAKWREVGRRGGRRSPRCGWRTEGSPAPGAGEGQIAPSRAVVRSRGDGTSQPEPPRTPTSTTSMRS